MLPANVPHAALSLSPHYLYGQTFHVKGRARDPTTLGLEPSALVKPLEAIVTVLTCYEEGLQDPDPRIGAIHVDQIVRTLSLEKTALRQAYAELYTSKVIEVLKVDGNFNGACGICRYLRLELQPSMDCWVMHDFDDGSLTSAGKREHRVVGRMRFPESEQSCQSACPICQ
jgi:hypothetical protein